MTGYAASSFEAALAALYQLGYLHNIQELLMLHTHTYIFHQFLSPPPPLHPTFTFLSQCTGTSRRCRAHPKLHSGPPSFSKHNENTRFSRLIAGMTFCRKGTCNSAATLSCCSVACLRAFADCRAEAWASCSAAPEVGLALTRHAARPLEQERMRMVKILIAPVRVAMKVYQVVVRQVYARWAPARRRITCKQLPRSGCVLHKSGSCRQPMQQYLDTLATGQADPRQC